MGTPHAKAFNKQFTPYRKRFLQQYRIENGLDLILEEWRIREQYLSDDRIEAAIKSRRLLGYFLAKTPRAFGTEIDDHYGKGEGYLLDVYGQVVSKLSGVRPSILLRSPRGLHAYWFLSYFVPWAILFPHLMSRLNEIPVEIRPTPNLGLRIPAEKNLIDPGTLLPIRKMFRQVVEDAPIYHPAEIFALEIMPNEVRESLQVRKSKYRRLRGATQIAKAEAEIGCVIPGESNSALCRLVPLYKSAGLDPEDAALKFQQMLAPVYDGELRNWHRLLQRVKSFYKRDVETIYNTPGTLQTDMFDQIVAERIAALWPDGKRVEQRRKTIQRFVINVLNWKHYIDGVYKEKSSLSAWNYIYPFFKKNVGEGYYPLPRNLMIRWYGKYELLVKWLIEIGFLKRSPYGYSASNGGKGLGVCLYYKIDGDRFL